MDDRITQIVKQAKEIIDSFQEHIEGMNELKDWDSLSEIQKNAGILVELFRQIGAIILVSKDIVLGADGVWTDEDEENLIELVIDTSDELITLPVYIEWLDNIIVEFLVNAGLAWAKKQTQKDPLVFAKYNVTVQAPCC